MNENIFTIGHSNHSIEKFLTLLIEFRVSALVDVRSHPYSSFVPQYDIQNLRKHLAESDIAYLFLGKELGARSKNPACYQNGQVQFELLSKEPEFSEGINRIICGISRFRIVLMCSEKDPINCHRSLLVSRELHKKEIDVIHIHEDSSYEDQAALESRLLYLCKLPEGDLFRGREECVEEAYEIQAKKVAYQKETSEEKQNILLP